MDSTTLLQSRIFQVRYIVLDPFPSTNVPPRKVDFWLPEGYAPARRYPVLYAHDGQNLFIPARFLRQGHLGGGREMLTALSFECIVVGVWNVGERPRPRIYPRGALCRKTVRSAERGSSPVSQAKPYSDAYLRFLWKN
jgi:hypothetical protein